MKTYIHRGKNQIGGNIIEISTEKTKILLDVGLELDNDSGELLPEIDGLFDSAKYDAIFISHYHGDHMGLAYYTHKDIPVYIGAASYAIIKASDNYKHRPSFIPQGFLQNKKSVVIGDIAVTPYLCDHSAFDSYMLLCESGGESILYTGDFRANGRKSFDDLLKILPKNIDKLICEGTTLSRENHIAVTEVELENTATDLFRNTTGPVFVLQSSMNIDRIVTMYRASKKSNRTFFEEVYMADIATAAGKSIPNPEFNDVYAFLTTPDNYQGLSKYKRKAGMDFISKRSFVMCIRNSMLGYLKSLAEKMSFENGLLIYSFWSGYRESEKMKYFLTECERLGLKIVTLHTSGHADENAIRRLLENVNPKVLIPVHTESAEKFKDLSPGISIEI